MKKLLLFCSFCLNLQALAQCHYTLSSTTQPYTPLTTGATSVNGSTAWTSESYSIPLPFSFQLNDTRTMSNYNLFLGTSLSPASDTNSNTLLSGFSVMDAFIVDRGYISGISASPIRYRTDGTIPSRIFKLEYANAGFIQELMNHSTMNDSVNVQVWVYEGSNVIEFHYGTAKVSYPSEYFLNTANPFISYISDINPNDLSNATFYYLKGNALIPTLDSIAGVNVSPTIQTINQYPPSGTVYRFTPKTTTAINDKALESVKVFPTVVDRSFRISSVPQGNYQYHLYSIDGRNTEIYGMLQPGENEIACNNLSGGLYLLNVTNTSSQNTISYKIIKH